jgi:hypothetical protein
MFLSDREYADMLSRQEHEGALSNRADDKYTPPAKGRRNTDISPDQAESKGDCKSEICYEDDEKACTPLKQTPNYVNDTFSPSGFLDEEDRNIREDEKMANRLHIAEQKELHKQRIGYLFDADYAKHLAQDESNDSKACCTEYVDKKWENVESYLDDVEGGICISLLLPELGSYEVTIFENFSVQVDAVKKHDKGARPVEYKADYSFEGATKGIVMDMIQHEYMDASGILFIFVDRLKLRGPSSQCFVSPGKADKEEDDSSPHLANTKEDNHFVNKNNTSSATGVGEAKKTNSFMLRVKKSTLGRMLAFNK